MVGYIDYASYPHIVDSILGFYPSAEWKVLNRLRHLCSDMRDRVDRIQLEHVVLESERAYVIHRGEVVPKVPALLPLRATTSGYSVHAGHHTSAFARIQQCAKVVDIVGLPTSALMTVKLSVPTLRLRGARDGSICRTPPPWTVDTLVMFPTGEFAFQPCQHFRAQIARGHTKLVVHPSWGQFTLGWKSLGKDKVIPLVVVFPSYVNSAVVLLQADRLLHAKGNFLLTFVVDERLNREGDIMTLITEQLKNKYREEQHRKLVMVLC